MWAVIGSITGVALGGAVSFISQWITSRAETRRHQENISEARRTERLTEIISYLKLIQPAGQVTVPLSSLTVKSSTVNPPSTGACIGLGLITASWPASQIAPRRSPVP